MIQGISRYVLGEYNNNKVLEVYNKAKELYRNPTPPPPSGFVENTMEIVLADQGLNPPGIFTVLTHGGQPQAKGGYIAYEAGNHDCWTSGLPGFNAWNEIELQGDPSQPTPCDEGGECGTDGCLKSFYLPEGSTQGLNLRIEVGRYYGYWMDSDFKWHEFTRELYGRGKILPQADAPVGTSGAKRQCMQDYFEQILLANKSRVANSCKPRTETGTTASCKPDSYYRWHGFGGIRYASQYIHEVRSIFVQQYARVILEDPNGNNDMSKSHFVMHVASDRKSDSGMTASGANCISRFKKLTADWQPFNTWCTSSGCSQAQFEANPPPFHSNI